MSSHRNFDLKILLFYSSACTTLFCEGNKWLIPLIMQLTNYCYSFLLFFFRIWTLFLWLKKTVHKNVFVIQQNNKKNEIILLRLLFWGMTNKHNYWPLDSRKCYTDLCFCVSNETRKGKYVHVYTYNFPET